MKQLWLIIKREYFTKVRNKSFIIMTFVTPISFIILSVLIGYLTSLNNDKERNVIVLDNSGLFSETFQSNKQIIYNYKQNLSIDEVKKQSKSSNAYAILYIPKDFENTTTPIELFSEESANNMVLDEVKSNIEKTLFYNNLRKENLDLDKFEQAKVSIDIKTHTISGEKTSKIASTLKFVFGGAMSYLLMIFIMVYGNMIMRSVIEEKTNRIIEIIVSSVKPIKLMLGKIIGTSMVGITQFILWLIIGGMVMTVLSTTFGVSPSQMEQAQTINVQDGKIITDILIEFFQFPIMKLVISFLLYFIGGYLLYSSMYASVGAAVDNEIDTQQFMFPIMLPLILAIYIGFFTASEDPHGSISVIFSHIPLTSPIIMLMRIPFGVSWGEILISLSLVYATFFLFLWFSAKIYRIGILMYGKKTTYKDLYKWIKNG